MTDSSNNLFTSNLVVAFIFRRSRRHLAAFFYSSSSSPFSPSCKCNKTTNSTISSDTRRSSCSDARNRTIQLAQRSTDADRSFRCSCENIQRGKKEGRKEKSGDGDERTERRSRRSRCATINKSNIFVCSVLSLLH